MEKPFKIILILILALLAIQFTINLFYFNPGLKSSLEKLDQTQQQLDSAKLEVRQSREKLDSMRINLLKFNNYLITIQGQTEVLYKERELKDARFKVQRDSILAEMEGLRLKVDSIELPELVVFDSRQPNK